MGREVLFNEIRFLRANVGHYMSMYDRGWAAWSPTAAVRSTWSLISHLAGLPSVAIGVLNEQPDEEIFELNEPLSPQESDQFLTLFQGGCDRLLAKLEAFSPEDFENKQFRNPFGPPLTPEQVALSAITHIYHHRGQLHSYYRSLGLHVNTDTLYLSEQP